MLPDFMTTVGTRATALAWAQRIPGASYARRWLPVGERVRHHIPINCVVPWGRTNPTVRNHSVTVRLPRMR
jgi:hypothetical protein